MHHLIFLYCTTGKDAHHVKTFPFPIPIPFPFFTPPAPSARGVLFHRQPVCDVIECDGATAINTPSFPPKLPPPPRKPLLPTSWPAGPPPQPAYL